MTVEQLLSYAVAAIIGGLVSGGAIAGLFYRALKDRLREDLEKTFAKRSDLDGVGSRVNGLETVLVQTRDRSDENAAEIARMQTADQHIGAHLNDTLTRIDRRLDELDRRERENRSAIDRTVSLLDALERRVDRHAQGKD